MPKPSLKNPFARRKSSGNVLDVESPSSETPPTQSSFRVIERTDKNTIVFGDDRRTSHVQRPFQSPLQQLRGKSVDDLTYHANGSVDTAASRKAASALKPGRGSGGTTHSGSSDVYQSSSASGRHSSSSTLPSSVEPENDEDELFPVKRTAAPALYKPLPVPEESSLPPPPPPPSFSARAQRAFSFGLKNKQSQDKVDSPISRPTTSSGLSRPQPPSPPPPLPQSQSPTRERALTTSSYASTAVPTRLDTMPDLGANDFGGDFGSMFEKPAVVSPAQRSDSEPNFAPKTHLRRGSTPFRKDSESPFPWDRRNSRDGLLASTANSPSLASDSATFSPPVEQSRGSGKKYELHDPQERAQKPSLMTTASAPALPLSHDNGASFSDEANPWDRESSSTTPRALKRESVLQDEELFDVPLNGSTRTAHRPEPSSSKSVPEVPRKLTKAQFEILQRYTDKTTDSADDDGESLNEEEDEDEVERAKRVAMQRRKQEANMAVYRQQMKKVTGGGPTDLPGRPGLDTRSSSIPSFHLGGVQSAPPIDPFRPKQGGEDEDDDIPLGILQAHGFPSANRPPTRLTNDFRSNSGAAQRNSQMPVFARRLPEDPYFGAGLYNPASRESFAFGGGSVYGGASAPSTPGGLVGVIAHEERQRQARRGSPNPVTGTYGGMPAMGRTSSMTSLQVPPGFPQMPMMPQMPMTNDPQMQEFMQMQMQFMANMQAMLVAQQTQMQQQSMASSVGSMPRPMSSASNLMMNMPPHHMDQTRATSMLTPPPNWSSMRPTSTLDPRMSTIAPSVSGLPAGYTPSIAPSERSNVGMPSRYRPVQTGEDGRTSSLTSSLTLNAFSAQPTTTVSQPVRAQSQQPQQRNSTIRLIDKPKGFKNPVVRRTDPEDDDEEKDGGWADMMKRKLKSKRSDRASRSGGERVALSELYPNSEL